QPRGLQGATRGGGVAAEPSGHAVRMDALHLIRAAAEFADTVENDAQRASQTQMQKTEEEIRGRNRQLLEREAEVDRYRQESERQRAEMLNNTRNEVRELLANANRDATQELTEAEARSNRLLEQARHQATELTNAARAEVEQTLEWARAQAAAVLQRAQNGAEQLLAAAGLGDEEIHRVAQSIVDAAEAVTEASRAPARPTTPAASAPPGAPPHPRRFRSAGRACGGPNPSGPPSGLTAESEPGERGTRGDDLAGQPVGLGSYSAGRSGSPVSNRGWLHHRGRRLRGRGAL